MNSRAVLTAVVVIVALTLAAVVAAVALVDDPDTTVAAIIGVSTPILLGLLGLLLNAFTAHLNSRLTELLDATREAGRAAGVEQGRGEHDEAQHAREDD